MFRYWCAVVALLLFGLPVFSQVVIAPGHRRPNERPGCCGYATVESVARHQGYHQLTGVTSRMQGRPYGGWVGQSGCPKMRDHPCFSNTATLRVAATRAGIPTSHRPDGSYASNLITYGLRTGQPVIVSTRGERRCQQGHVYAIVGATSTHYLLYNTNQVDRPYVRMSKPKFSRLWEGGSLLLHRR